MVLTKSQRRAFGAELCQMTGIVSKDSVLLFESSSVQANRVSPEKQLTPSPTSFSS